ncbi:MAG: aminodeoxychorismate/anthranilate synthase component II [Verrucomicrobia bacterium]|nr:aminodeoxychorismate/anthranilate synthase component II [Verrucomicrobiota bacterium]MCH8526376.1 aminodeoxychorismate/anthranilate synthase component II [Kiritimatiellia bacterium]
MILVLDNYDSFTYNLVQYLGVLGAELKVVRNDEVTVAEIEAMGPEKILVSPGPCSPAEAGVSVEVIKHFGEKMPVFGVCLGHQSIGHAYGGRVVRADRLMHGKTSPIHHDNTSVFKSMPNPFDATRYHSLIVEKASLPECLRVTAWTEEGEIMGLAHKTLPVFGVQFHPESVLTQEGMTLMRNFVEM